MPVAFVTNSLDRHVMSRGTLRQTVTLLTAAMLLVQAATSSSAACLCGTPVVEVKLSCCQAESKPADCCSQPKSCCSTGEYGCGDSNAFSQCSCGCGDDHESQPYTPAEKPERSENRVELSLQAVCLAADTVGLFPQQRLVEVTTPHPQSASHSTQSLLCIWQT